MEEDFRHLIESRDFQNLENRWLEMIERDPTRLEEYFVIAEELKKINELPRALILLEFLAGHLESIAALSDAIRVYKVIAYYTPGNSEIRKKLIDLYRLNYQQSKRIEEFIQYSRIETDENLFRALNRFEEHLKFDIGRHFYFENYGLGQVIDFNLSKGEIVFNFEKKGRHFLNIEVAKKLLTPIDQEHFLYKKHYALEDLKKSVNSDPVGLIIFLLKSFACPLNANQIKFYLEGIIETEEISKFWEKFRKKIEADPNVRVTGKNQKTYQYVTTGIDKSTETIENFSRASIKEKIRIAFDLLSRRSDIIKKVMQQLIEISNKTYKDDPVSAFEIAVLCKNFISTTGGGNDLQPLSYTIDELFTVIEPEEIIAKLQLVTSQKFLLNFIKDRFPDNWPEIFKNIAFVVGNPPILNVIEESLRENPPLLKELYQSIIIAPKNHPDQFKWLLKKMAKGELVEFFTSSVIARLIDSLEQINGIKPMILKILNLEAFDRLIGQTTLEDARRILASLKNSSTLADWEKRNFIRIIEFHFPQLFKKDDDVIYATKESLNKKKEELQRLLTVEIPENKREISRAREYGDLSENFEYKVAREKQDQLYQKVRDLESALLKTKIIDPATIDIHKVSVGTKVTLEAKKDQTRVSYTILGRWDTNLDKNIISNEAPLARHLLGKTVGAMIKINDLEYEIVAIEKAL